MKAPQQHSYRAHTLRSDSADSYLDETYSLLRSRNIKFPCNELIGKFTSIVPAVLKPFSAGVRAPSDTMIWRKYGSGSYFHVSTFQPPV